MKMEINLGCVIVSVLLQCLAAQVLAQNQSGFINLDCGLVPEDTSYIEKSTNLTYISDAAFINTGESRSIKNEYKPSFQQQTWYLRSFPRGIRNCYRMNLTKGVHYLIKASFLYGNYDDLNQAPEFDLHIGTNFWTKMKVLNATSPMGAEVMHILSSDHLQVCLVKTGRTTPFISALEVRPLNKDTYDTQAGSLRRFARVYVGSETDQGIRYPEDVRDRDWNPVFENDWTRLTTMRTGNISNNDYEVPQRALMTAATPKNASQPLNLTVPLEPSTLIYVYFHFAEVEVLKANESRVFNITYNGINLIEYFRPSYTRVITLASPQVLGPINGKYEFLLQKTENSTHPPIINALEVYMVIELIQPETDQNDVNAMMGIKAAYGVNRDSWQGDPCAPQNISWSGLSCSYHELDPPRIISLNLSGSGLTGEITHLISDLHQLENLDLSGNDLTGGVPDFLLGMTSLKVLNLRENQLTGPVPPGLIERTSKGSLTLSLGGNPGLCESDPCFGSKNNTVVVAVVASVLSVSVAVAMAFIIFLRRRKKKATTEVETQGASRMPLSLERKDRKFSYSEVLKITNNFQTVLGRGGFGAVYHGYLDDDQVAVKMLDESSTQGFKQFKAEVELLLRVHHRYLVSLVGYCDEGDKLALIYEFMANRDLKEHLSGMKGASTLTWEARLRVASEAAQGLEYLHHGCRPPIVHRDVKMTNILLNEHFQAKLADFGLSRSFLAENETHVSTVVAGTPGFLDPEYWRSNWLTEKSDVYSFGVVLLQIITNQPAIDQTRGSKSHLGDWVNFMVGGGDIGKIVDPNLQGQFGNNSAWKFIEVALACVSQSSSRRPTMTHVVMELNECLALETARIHGSQETADSRDSFIQTEEISFSTELMPRPR